MNKEIKKKLDKMRSSCLYENEVLKVRYTGNCCGFHKGKVIDAVPRTVQSSGLPYPYPKKLPSWYEIIDEDGDKFQVATTRYGELYPGFEWVMEDE